MKTKIIVATFIILLVFSSLFFANLYFKERQNSKRLNDDLVIKNGKIESFTAKNGTRATRTGAFQLKPSEVKDAFPDVTRKLDNLYLKPRQTESFSESTTQMQTQITAPLKDSIPDRPSTATRSGSGPVPELNPELVEGPIKTFSFSDEWVKVRGTITDSVRLKISAIDTIFTAIYYGDRRHPWAWILSKRKLEVVASNVNPDITIQVVQAGIIRHRKFKRQ